MGGKIQRNGDGAYLQLSHTGDPNVVASGNPLADAGHPKPEHFMILG